jgi:hypothetical protein
VGWTVRVNKGFLEVQPGLAERTLKWLGNRPAGRGDHPAEHAPVILPFHRDEQPTILPMPDSRPVRWDGSQRDSTYHSIFKRSNETA